MDYKQTLTNYQPRPDEVRHDPGHVEYIYSFGEASIVLFVSEGHRATLRAVARTGETLFFAEYGWDAIEQAKRHAYGLARFGLMAIASLFPLTGEMVA